VLSRQEKKKKKVIKGGQLRSKSFFLQRRESELSQDAKKKAFTKLQENSDKVKISDFVLVCFLIINM
jgi:hypothetical protein